ncbi:hypothetical protein B296_00026438, partial [Ensete ventricosum]
GAGSSFSQKDALALSLPPLHRHRRCPYVGGDCPLRPTQPPLLAVAPCGRPAVSPLAGIALPAASAHHACRCRPCGLPPLADWPWPQSAAPIRGPWPWVADPT